ncbi:MAG: transglycosylase SLT domain-containing protein [Deltaproteobacteria bacterium]|nr:transglycosylase SLT domain-containing protein [Deltaproteobacteria bacterium]
MKTEKLLRWGLRALWALGLLIVVANPAHGAELEPAQFPSLISSIRALGPLEFCGEPASLETPETRERLEKEVMLYVWSRPQVVLWLKRSTRYFPYIETMLREAEVPDDLKYVAVVESALLPYVRSRKKAVGFWQFLASTGRRYGLVINGRIDQRRNLFASTQAAIRYLKDLHAMFGSWTLAVAAYNMGEDGLMAEIMEQGTTDYYSLYLPVETQRFVLRILAVKLILSDPAMFGFELTEEDYYPQLAFDEVQVDCSENTPIRIIAQAAKTHFKVIKDLNPEIRGHYLASGSHDLLIPKGASEGFHARLRRLEKVYLAEKRGQIYVIKRGDNLSLIAEDLNIPLSTLIICNDLDPRRPIHPGNELFICNEGTKPKTTNAEKTKKRTKKDAPAN